MYTRVLHKWKLIDAHGNCDALWLIVHEFRHSGWKYYRPSSIGQLIFGENKGFSWVTTLSIQVSSTLNLCKMPSGVFVRLGFFLLKCDDQRSCTYYIHNALKLFPHFSHFCDTLHLQCIHSAYMTAVYMAWQVYSPCISEQILCGSSGYCNLKWLLNVYFLFADVFC